MTPTCVFCGRERQPDEDWPPEHVWPQWVGRVLGVSDQSARHTLAEGDSTVREQWMAPGLDVTVDSVCGCCNHGWMGRLEDRVHPLLTPMMLRGTETDVGVETRTLLAVWATKTAMMFEQVHPDDAGVPPEHYGELYRDHTRPPEHTTVWMGRYDPADTSLRYRFVPLSPPEAVHSAGRGEAYGSSFTVGQVCFLVFGHPVHEHISVEYQECGIVRIYPVHRGIDVTWPPEAYLSFSGFVSLTDGLGVWRSDG